MDVHEHNMRVFYGDYDTTISFNERVQIHKNRDDYYIVANGTLQKIYRNPTMILILNNMGEHFKTVGYWTIPKKYVQVNEDELFMITEENGEYFYDAVGKVLKWTFSKISL